MTSQEDVLKSLSESGLLDALRWSARTAFALTEETFREELGHDQTVLGTLNFKHLCDLMDRVTSNGRFSLGVDVEGLGSDVLAQGLWPEAIESMPMLSPGSITKSPYRGSPGWAAAGFRILLQSHKYGKVDEVKWADRSDAKRKVAAQPYFDGDALFTPEEFGLEVLPGGVEDDEFEGTTLVAAHAYNPVTGEYEVHIGQSKNPLFAGDSCWRWRVKVVGDAQGVAGALRHEGLPVLRGVGASSDVADVEVRIKKLRTDKELGSANG